MASGIQRSAGIFSLPKAESLAGSKLYFYQTGTSTPVAVYTDLTLAVPHTQPVVADSAGRFAPIYIDGATGDLRVSHYTSADVLIYIVDNYPASLGTTSSIDVNDSTTPLIQLVQSGASSNNKAWYIRISGQQFRLSMVNDSFAAAVDFMTASRSANSCTQVNFATNLFTVNGAQVVTGESGYKATTETRNTTTTLTADNDLTVSLIASSNYVIECALYFYATTTAGMGMKFDITGTGGVSAASGRAGPLIQHVNGTGAVSTMNTFPATPISLATISTNASAVDSVRFSQYFTTAAAGTAVIRWAQASSSANNLNLLNGSWIRAYRLN